MIKLLRLPAYQDVSNEEIEKDSEYGFLSLWDLREILRELLLVLIVKFTVKSVFCLKTLKEGDSA